jgi:hypothetical protein
LPVPGEPAFPRSSIFDRIRRRRSVTLRRDMMVDRRRDRVTDLSVTA